MSNYNKLSDTDLWQLITADDSVAFRELFDRYWTRVFTTAFSYLKDREACIELVDDIFLNIWLKRNQLHIESFSAYLTACSRYHVYKKIRANRAAPVDLVENYEGIKTFQRSLNGGEHNVQYKDLEQRTDNYLLDLPKRCREIFIMSRKEHLSNDEIAVRLNISKRTVENQITHALKHLRMSFKDLTFLLLLFKFFF